MAATTEFDCTQSSTTVVYVVPAVFAGVSDDTSTLFDGIND